MSIKVVSKISENSELCVISTYKEKNDVIGLICLYTSSFSLSNKRLFYLDLELDFSNEEICLVSPLPEPRILLRCVRGECMR